MKEDKMLKALAKAQNELKRIEKYYSGLTPKCESEVVRNICEVCNKDKYLTSTTPDKGLCVCIQDQEERKCTLGKVFKNCSNWTPLNSQGCLGCDHYKIQDQEECWACFKKLPKGHKSGLCSDCQIRG